MARVLLRDSEQKTQYLACSLYSNLVHWSDVDDRHALDLIRKVLGVTYNGSCDHQSKIQFPKDFYEKAINIEFVEELAQWIKSDKIAIIGGNDNDDEECSRWGHNKRLLKIALPRLSGSLVCRKEGDGYWTIFDRANGHKIKISFKHGVKLTKPSTPELVDLKITDWCDKECRWCYQGSTAKGNHADFGTIKEIIKQLKDLQVFEVALGGGEPTTHPDFIEILRECRRNFIVPNFTTKSLDWIKDASEIYAQIGSFAYSVSSALEAQQAADTIPHLEWPKRYSFNCALGTTSENELRKIFEIALRHGINVNILGYKESGRGQEFRPHKNNDWFADYISIHNKMYGSCTASEIIEGIGIDTLIAQQFVDVFKQHNIPEELYDLNEGKFSFYLDAVAGKIGPSSYQILEPYNFGDPIIPYFQKY